MSVPLKVKAYYKLDGNANDSSGNGFHATDQGVTYSTTIKKYGTHAATNNGVSRKALIIPQAVENILSAEAEWSIIFWFWPRPTINGAPWHSDMWFSKSRDGWPFQNDSLWCNLRNNYNDAFLDIVFSNIQPAIVNWDMITREAWHRLNYEYSSITHTGKLFIDAVLFMTASGVYTNPMQYNRGDPFYFLDSLYHDNNNAPGGYIDNIMISTGNENGAEIYEISEPIINTITPNIKGTAGGQDITITGSAFIHDAQIYFNNILADNITVIDYNNITCTAPALDAGTYDITIINPDTGHTTAAAAFNSIDYIYSPTTSNITGSAISLTGNLFTDDMTVFIDGVPVTDFIFIDAQHITFKTPAHAEAVGLELIINAPAYSDIIAGYITYSSAPYSGAAPIFDKNKQASAGAWLPFLEITGPGIDTPIRIVKNNENRFFDGAEYTAIPFIIGDLSENTNGEIPDFNIQISNITREIQLILENTNGGVGASIKFMIINIQQSAIIWQGVFSVLFSSCDENFATLTCGLKYPITSRRPLRTTQKYICPWIYGDTRCAISDAKKTTYPTCSKNITACLERTNTERYGGEINVPGPYFG